MATPKFGSRKFSIQGSYSEQVEFPERKAMTFRDFRLGYVPSAPRHLIDPSGSPNSYDVFVRRDMRLQRTPGTSLIEVFTGTLPGEDEYDEYPPENSPSLLALHPTLNELVELVLVNEPYIGFRDTNEVYWYDLGLVKRNEFASTTFGGSFIFSDGLKVWARDGVGKTPKPVPEASPAVAYVSFAGRVFAFGTLIDGRWEPLGVKWTGASSNYTDWEGLGAGFELLINDVSSGDKIVSALPMGLDTVAIMLRQSIWIGRFTGQFDRPADFSVRVPGIGAVNSRVSALSRFGVIFLADNGVYMFDGNTASLISEQINSELLPIDYDRLDEYHATYDPSQKRYFLFTPSVTWVLDVESQRWHKRTFTCRSAVMWPSQIDGTRWFEILGNWNNQDSFIWRDFAGKNIGDLGLYMLGDRMINDTQSVRALEKENPASGHYFGRRFNGYWETSMQEEPSVGKLVTSEQQFVEYEGKGAITIHLPNIQSVYVPSLEVYLGERSNPSLATFNFQRTGKGAGIGIEFVSGDYGDVIPLPPCQEVSDEDFPPFDDAQDYDYDDYRVDPAPLPGTAGCSDIVLTFWETGTINIYEMVVADILLIAQGGTGGGFSPQQQGGDTFFRGLLDDEDAEWSIYPAAEPSDALRADGGGYGGFDEQNGGDGGCGGGGGGSSPWFLAGVTNGGRGERGQNIGGNIGSGGGGGGGGLGLLMQRSAFSGDGGSFIGGGVSPKGWRVYQPPSALDPNWPGIAAPRGGFGSNDQNNSGTAINLGGGGGAGGVRRIFGVRLMPGTYEIVVGARHPRRLSGGNRGQGGRGAGKSASATAGFVGLALLRIYGFSVDDEGPIPPPAILSGGTLITANGWRYHVFQDNGSIGVVSAGWADSLSQAGGGGGGSGAGGGGGAGGCVQCRIIIAESLAIGVGVGGDGGIDGNSGENGVDSFIADLIRAIGGGGGQGANEVDDELVSAPGGSSGGGAGRLNSIEDAGLVGAAQIGQGNPGGEGRGYGTVRWGGGGGGAGIFGEDGPIDAGIPLSQQWGAGSQTQNNVAGRWEVTADQKLRSLVSTAVSVLPRKDVAIGTCFLQTKFVCIDPLGGLGLMRPGAIFRFAIGETTGSNYDGYRLQSTSVGVNPAGFWRITDNSSVAGTNLATITPISGSLSIPVLSQGYVTDGKQEFWTNGQRTALSDTTHDGKNVRTTGVIAIGGGGGTGKVEFSEQICMRSAFIQINDLPLGTRIDVLIRSSASRIVNAYAVVATSPPGNQTFVDCSLYTNTTVAGPIDDIAIPFEGIQQITISDSVTDEILHIFAEKDCFPGAILEWTGSSLRYVVDPDGLPITGLVYKTQFRESFPGPTLGTGGDGRYVPGFYPAISERYIGGGGGGGGEDSGSLLLPIGGKGGGGDGTLSASISPADGQIYRGGGGGGSRAMDQRGGAGGKGLVIVRTLADLRQRLGGGTVSFIGDYVYHVFNAGDEVPIENILGLPVYVDVIAVGAGGGGGYGDTGSGGGGGGGRVIVANNFVIPRGQHIISVGRGGKGATTVGTKGENGGTTFVGNLLSSNGGGGGGTGIASFTHGGFAEAAPGGGGAGLNASSGTSLGAISVFGDGGDGVVSTTTTQRNGGGGGGMTEDGADATTTAGGKGGDGVLVAEFVDFGASGYFGGGGGGGSRASGSSHGIGGLGGGANGGSGTSTTPGGNGVNGTGGGGGGSRQTGNGGDGGDGIVIIRYLAATYGS
jgi:hypothetical protein